jgi:uncharacterized protein (TIGR03000 family)
LQVKLPADAILFIEEYRTRATGELRRFQSPPLTPGKQFTYTLKATWKEDGKDKTVTRDIKVRAGQELTIDLTQPSDPAPVALFTLLPPPALVTVKAGETTTVKIGVKRTNFTEPIEIQLTGAPPKVTAGAATIPGNKDEIEVALSAEKDVVAGSHSMKLLAVAGTLRKEVALRLAVENPSARISLQPLPPLKLKPGDKANLNLQLKREFMTGPVEVTVKAPDKVTIGKATIAADKSSAQVPVEIARDAAAGTNKVTLQLASGTFKGESTFDLIVELPPPPAKFTLDLPPALTLKPGEKKTLTVKAKRENLTLPIALDFKGAPAKVKLDAKSIIPGNKDSVDVAVEAAADAAPGTSKVTVSATAGTLAQEGTFNLVIDKPPPPAGSFKLEPSNDLIVLTPGGTTTVVVKIKRDNFVEPVEVTVKDLPAKVQTNAPSFRILGNQDTARVVLAVDKEAPAGKGKIQIIAKAGAAQEVTTLQVEVVPAPKPAGLKLTLPPELVLAQGEKKSFPVKIERENLTGAVTVKCECPDKGLTIKEANIPAGQNQVDIVVEAAKDAKESSEITVTVSSGTTREVKKLKVKVPGTKPEPPAPAALMFSVPAVLTLEPGGKKSVTIKLNRATYKEEVEIEIKDLPRGVTAKDAEIDAGKTDATIEFVADKDAKEGEKTIKIVAKGKGAKTSEGKILLKIEKPKPQPQ